MFWLFVFIVSCLLLFWSGSHLVLSLMGIARYLHLREFIVAFFIMAFAGSLPNLFIGIHSALQKIPELSFAEIVGGNVVDLTLAVALAVLITGDNLPVRSKMGQTSTFFTAAIAVLPLILIWDGSLTKQDGWVLLLAFGLYLFWLFSREERFRKVYKNHKKKTGPPGKKPAFSFFDFLMRKKGKNPFLRFRNFLKNLIGSIFFLALLLAASWGVVESAQAFSALLGLSLPIIGILIVGLGNALPETYFALASARKHQTWMILGDLMGSVIVCSTLILGIVVLICPIENIDISPFAIARIFLILAAVFFFISVKTDRKITKKEAFFLLLIYIFFIAAEIIFH